jgi:hypothetical protein
MGKQKMFSLGLQVGWGFGYTLNNHQEKKRAI